MAIPPVPSSTDAPVTQPRPVFPTISPLYQAAVTVSGGVMRDPLSPIPAAVDLPAPAPAAPLTNNTPDLAFSVTDFRNFLGKISTHGGLSFEQLRGVSTAGLSPAEASMLQFLQTDQTRFNLIARLSGDPNLLNVDDIQRAALPGDFLVLTANDLTFLQEPVLPAVTDASVIPTTATTAGEATAGPTAPTITPDITTANVMSFLNQINPNGVTVQELGTFLANNPTLDTDTTSNEAAAVNGAITTFLGNPSVMGALSTLVGQTSNGIMTPTMISMLLTLVGNPIYNYGVPIAFFEAPRPEELVTATQGTTRYGNTHFTKEHPPLEHANASNLHDNETFLPIELSEHKLTELLQRLAPNGLVPLRTLQQYQPQDFEEMKLINALKNKPIFEALAKLDGQGDSLSADDIHIAASKDHIFLMDQHLALVFKP